MGGTIGICTDCLKEATESIKAYTEPPKVVREDTPLFPHPELEVTISSVADAEPKPKEVISTKTEENPISVAEDTVTEEVKPITQDIKPQTRAKAQTNKGKKK